MLTKSQKIAMFKECLELKNGSYGDKMKEELFFHFFELENDFSFLKKLNSQDEIYNRVDFIIGKLVMHEDESSLKMIIENYI